MKPHTLAGLAIIAAAALLASCADDVQTAALSPTESTCFHPLDVTAFDKLSVIKFDVHTQRGDIFSADLPVCGGIDFAQQVALKPQRGNTICEGDIATLVTRNPGGQDMTCNAYNFHHLSDAEVARLPANAQPNG